MSHASLRLHSVKRHLEIRASDRDTVQNFASIRVIRGRKILNSAAPAH